MDALVKQLGYYDYGIWEYTICIRTKEMLIRIWNYHLHNGKKGYKI